MIFIVFCPCDALSGVNAKSIGMFFIHSSQVRLTVGLAFRKQPIECILVLFRTQRMSHLCRKSFIESDVILVNITDDVVYLPALNAFRGVDPKVLFQ